MLLERRFHQRLDPVVHRSAQRQAGDGDRDLRRRQVKLQTVKRLAGQSGCPVSLLGKLIDLGGSHLDQRELGCHEKTVNQNQTRDQQDLKCIPCPAISGPQRG